MRDTEVAVCVVRDADHFVKLQLSGFNSNVKDSPQVGDKIKVVAMTSYPNNDILVLEGDYGKITKIVDDETPYTSLAAVASPGKVSFFLEKYNCLFCFMKQIFLFQRIKLEMTISGISADH